jgi:hypothetical protein
VIGLGRIREYLGIDPRYPDTHDPAKRAAKYKARAKRRAKNKVAKQSRKRNRR